MNTINRHRKPPRFLLQCATAGLLVAVLALLASAFPIPILQEKAEASLIGNIELLDKRTQTSKTYWLGGDQYALDVSIGSIHYQDEQGTWQNIESDILPSDRVNWDWEVTKGHWQLLIKDDTTVAVGKDGHWLGFQYQGFAYLDIQTKEYVILDNRREVTPYVEGNKIRWEGIFHGVNLEYIYGNDRFKENLEVTQVARDWLKNNPPSSYGLNNQNTYLVGYLQCDWRYAYSAEDEDGEEISWDIASEFETTSIFFRHPVKDYLVSALPLDYARHDDVDPEDWVPIRKRFIKKGDSHYLLFGASVTELNQLPIGTITFDPPVDEQVGAGEDDAHEKTDSSGFNRVANYIAVYYFGYYNGGHRFQTVAVPNSATIDVAYISVHAQSTSYDDPDCRIYLEDVDDAVSFSTNEDVTSRTKTTEFTVWQATGIGTGEVNSPSIVDAVQEVVDRGGWAENNAMVVILEGVSESFFITDSYEEDTAECAKLHIEYTAGGPSAPTVVTNAATSVEETTATLSGNITAAGGENPSHRGFYWDIDTGNPYANSWLEGGDFGVGEFTHGITSLTKGELYYYIATANNSGGTGNGTELKFLTKPDEPTSLTDSARTSSNITIGWSTGTGFDNTVIRHRTDQYPTSPTDGTSSYNSTGASTTVTGLNAGQIYYFRAWSWCSEGGLYRYSDSTSDDTAYTLPSDPSGLVTENVTATSIDLRWTQGTGGDKTMVRRKTGSYPADETDGSQAYFDTANHFDDTSLDKGTTYYYRAWAYDSDSAYYSDGYTSSSNTTSTTAPTVTNDGGATSIADTTARLRGELTDDGGLTCNVTICWGLTDGTDNISAWGNVEDLTPITQGTFYYDADNLTAETQYFYRCTANNTEGIDWANSTANFTTLAEGEALSPPTNFTAVYVNENEVTLTWTLGDFAELTMIRANYRVAPANIEEGYCVYYGAASNATDTLVELNLRDATIHYSAWSENTTMSWSDDYATASVENLGMSDLVDAILPIVIVIIFLVIAHWRRITILYVLAGFACIIYGFVYWSGGIYISLLVILLGMVSFLEAWLDKGKAVK